MTSTSLVQSEVGSDLEFSHANGLQAGSDSVRLRELEAALRASEERLAAELADTRLLQELMERAHVEVHPRRLLRSCRIGWVLAVDRKP